MNEVQTIAVASATAGTWDLQLPGLGDETPDSLDAIDWDADAAALQALIDALDEFESGDIVVSGGAGGSADLVLTFGGRFAEQDIDLAVGDGTSLTDDDAAVTETTAGVGPSQVPGETGFLLASLPVDTDAAATADLVGAILTRGRIVEANLPLAIGAGFKEAVGGRFEFT